MIVKNRKKKKGFTLVELVAVIAMIAILAMAFVPKVTGYITEAKKVVVIDQAKKVLTAYETITLKSSSALTENATVQQIINKSNGLLETEDVNKLHSDTPLTTCKNILNTEEYTFKINSTDGKLTPNSVVKYTSINN